MTIYTPSPKPSHTKKISVSDSVQIEGEAHLKIIARKGDFDDFHHVYIKRHIQIYTTHLHNYKNSANWIIYESH